MKTPLFPQVSSLLLLQVLMKNNNVIVKGTDDNQKSDYLADNGGNSAVLELQREDKMSVHLPANRHVGASNKNTSFSGFLVSH